MEQRRGRAPAACVALILSLPLLAVAARVGPARLIDNFVLKVEDAGGKGISESHLLGTGEEI